MLINVVLRPQAACQALLNKVLWSAAPVAAAVVCPAEILPVSYPRLLGSLPCRSQPARNGLRGITRDSSLCSLAGKRARQTPLVALGMACVCQTPAQIITALVPWLTSPHSRGIGAQAGLLRVWGTPRKEEWERFLKSARDKPPRSWLSDAPADMRREEQNNS